MGYPVPVRELGLNPNPYAKPSPSCHRCLSLITCLHKGSDHFSLTSFKFSAHPSLFPHPGLRSCVSVAWVPLFHPPFTLLVSCCTSLWAWTWPQNPSQHSPLSGPCQSLELVLKSKLICHPCSGKLTKQSHYGLTIPVFPENILGIFCLVCFPCVGPRSTDARKCRLCLSLYQVRVSFMTWSSICLILCGWPWDQVLRHGWYPNMPRWQGEVGLGKTETKRVRWRIPAMI